MNDKEIVKDDLIEDVASEPAELEPVEADNLDEVEAGSVDLNTGDDAPEDNESDDNSEFVVSFGEQDDDSVVDTNKAPDWVRDLRREHRTATKRIKELESELSKRSDSNQQIELGVKPTLESCDWDDEKYQSQLVDWMEKNRKVEEQKKAEQRQTEEQQAEWGKKLEAYNEAKADLKQKGARNLDEAEGEFSGILSPARQGLVVEVAKNAAQLVYALGLNPDKTQKLADIKSDVQFIAEIVRLESKMTTKGKQKPNPERRLKGGDGAGNASTSKIEKKIAEARAAGDTNKVIELRKTLKALKT